MFCITSHSHFPHSILSSCTSFHFSLVKTTTTNSIVPRLSGQARCIPFTSSCSDLQIRFCISSMTVDATLIFTVKPPYSTQFMSESLSGTHSRSEIWNMFIVKVN
mmetsp:Transcript_3877/g.8321  ORF Transcript_3877/g.8321 Transcript_3877/m.8321 type:complete len:105 (+) Transcript_3877:1856-2170(+)